METLMWSVAGVGRGEIAAPSINGAIGKKKSPYGSGKQKKERLSKTWDGGEGGDVSGIKKEEKKRTQVPLRVSHPAPIGREQNG